MIHTDVHERQRHVAPYNNVRIYHYAGTQHGPGVLPLKDAEEDSRTTHSFNTVDYRPLLRAALTSMDRWVSQGEPPPASQHPRIDDGTAVSQGECVQGVPVHPRRPCDQPTAS